MSTYDPHDLGKLFFPCDEARTTYEGFVTLRQVG